MSDSSPTDPRFQGSADVTRQVAASDWNRAEIESPPDDLPKRERVFPRKVLIGWALFALALYFGVRVVGTVIKESFRGAVSTAVDNTGRKEIIYQTPNGRVTIRRTNGGAIEISKAEPGTPKPPTTVTVEPNGVTITHPPVPPPLPAHAKR